jgi:hypothetical protein
MSGLFTPVDYSKRIRYRRPPWLYRHMQWLGPLLTTAGLSPRYVLTMEIPGRRTGVIHRTNLVKARHDGDDFLVALSGESEWVRNVRAADGRVVVGRRRRHAARLVELPPDVRAPILRAYLLRSGRQVGNKAVNREALRYFGVSQDLSPTELAEIAVHYPVFRIEWSGHRAPPA